MKRLSPLLITCLAISANASNFDAKGRILSTNEIKNPGIIKFDKSIKQNNNDANYQKGLFKASTNNEVTKTSAVYDSEQDIYYLDGKKRTKETFFRIVNDRESHDAPRNNFEPVNYTSNIAPYPSNNGENCELLKNVYFHLDNEYLFDPQFVPTLGFQDEINGRADCSTKSHITYNACGSAINIYNVVGDKPISYSNQTSCKNSISRDYSLGIESLYAKRHMQEVSPNATIKTINEGDARENHKFATANYPKAPFLNNVHIINTIASSKKNTITYHEEAAAIDDYIYNNRVVEFVPYTKNGQLTGAGLSLNAISVAEIDAAHVSPHGLPTKPLLNTERYAKPDIYQYSYVAKNGSTFVKYGSSYKIAGTTDSWGGASIAAAMTADLISKYPFYKWHPEVVKALWISAYGGENDDVYTINDNPNAKIENAHISNINDLLKNNRSRYWYGNNDDHFDNEKITFSDAVEPGQKYAIATAWLIDGKYTLSKKKLSSNYTMTIYDKATGNILAKSDNGASTFRKIEIKAPAGVTQITVEIKRITNAGDRVIIGFNKHKIARI